MMVSNLGRRRNVTSPAATVFGRPAIPKGAEQIIVMNGQRLHEIRQNGQWVILSADPQGTLPRGVHRLDTATPATPYDGMTYVGAVLHIGSAGLYQAHGVRVVRHDPNHFQDELSIGELAMIAYADGRACLVNRNPGLPAVGPDAKS